MKESLRKYGEFYSWTILDDNTAIKKTDKSFFFHHGSGIPMEIRWFFDAQQFPDKEHDIHIDLIYNDQSYDGKLNLHKVGKVRIFWHADLDKELRKHFQGEDYPLAQFEKISDYKYRISFIDEIGGDYEEKDPLESVFIPLVEGQKKEYYVTRYERNRKNRENAIRIHGLNCMACGFNFASFYGEAGKNFIEVHHIKPLADKDEEAMINPESDLVCLCSNCHRMIHHKKNGVYTVNEIKEMISRGRKN